MDPKKVFVLLIFFAPPFPEHFQNFLVLVRSPSSNQRPFKNYPLPLGVLHPNSLPPFPNQTLADTHPLVLGQHIALAAYASDLSFSIKARDGDDRKLVAPRKLGNYATREKKNRPTALNFISAVRSSEKFRRPPRAPRPT